MVGHSLGSADCATIRNERHDATHVWVNKRGKIRTCSPTIPIFRSECWERQRSCLWQCVAACEAHMRACPHLAPPTSLAVDMAPWWTASVCAKFGGKGKLAAKMRSACPGCTFSSTPPSFLPVLTPRLDFRRVLPVVPCLSHLDIMRHKQSVGCMSLAGVVLSFHKSISTTVGNPWSGCHLTFCCII